MCNFLQLQAAAGIARHPSGSPSAQQPIRTPATAPGASCTDSSWVTGSFGSPFHSQGPGGCPVSHPSAGDSGRAVHAALVAAAPGPRSEPSARLIRGCLQPARTSGKALAGTRAAALRAF